MKQNETKSISKFIFLLPIIGVLLTSILLGFIAIYTIKQNEIKSQKIITENFMNNLKITTKQRINLTYNIIDAVYQSEKNKMSKKEIIFLLQKIFAKMRWDKKGYIFVFDYKGNTLYHPNHYYMTINRWNFKRKGKFVIRNLILTALKHPNGIYVKYLAYNPDGIPIEKISYLKIYKPLNIILGTGVYLDYLDKRLLILKKQNKELINNLLLKFILIGSITIGLILIIIIYFANKLKFIFKEYAKDLNIKNNTLFVKANFDNLTGLYNRDFLLLELDILLEDIKRKNTKLAVLFIDLDQFKDINDSLGHKAGDLVLQIISDRIKSNIRKIDIASRFGGDEFIVVLNDIKNIEDVKHLANRILEDIKQPIIIQNKKYHISASIGVSIAPDDSIDKNMLIQYADTVMYSAKNAGKDRIVFYTKKLSETANQKMEIKNELYNALENNQFKLYYQPQIDKFNKLVGMECLIRWLHPEKGVISPFHFIPIATEIGIIDKVDNWVLEEAIIQYQKWQVKGYSPGIISCNITPFQLEKGDFYIYLKNLLEKYNFNPKHFAIEILEEGLMKNPTKSIEVLTKIRDLGVHINIDDFGTGYSSFAYLKKFPISKLKIDRTFIKDIPNDKDDLTITKTIINLAKNLNLEVIAEGVETEIQRDFVFQNGCDYIQGYFYSPPIPANEFENKFLKDTNDSK